MNLHAKLLQRQAEGRPVRVGLIGAGKFGSMYLAQIPRTPGVQLVGIADLSPAAAQRLRERRAEVALRVDHPRLVLRHALNAATQAALAADLRD